MANKFGAARSLTSADQTQKGSDSLQAARIHLEMFKAIELLGRKLERVDNERDRLAQRLALIESATEVDQKTGKVYLPVRIDPASVPAATAPRWHTVSSVMSASLAIFALVIVLFHRQPQELSPQQIAAINKMMTLQLAQLERTPSARHWQPIEETLAENKVENIKPSVTQLKTPEKPKAVVIALPGEIGPFAAPPVVAMEKEKIEKEKRIEPAINAAPKTVTREVGEPIENNDIPPVVAQEEIPSIQTPSMAIKADARLPGQLKGLENRAFEGVAEAQHDLATIYASGQGVRKDYKRAAYWFFQAAGAGIANAHYNLGVMFQQGLGVNKDFKKSLRWYESAAKLGHPEAMYNLGIAYVEGVGGVRDLDRGVAYFKKAANAGVAQAAFNLGVLYESGFIGSINRTKALDWYRVAANNNHTEANDAVTRLEAQMAVAGSGQKPADAEDVESLEPAAGEIYGEGDASQKGDESN